MVLDRLLRLLHLDMRDLQKHISRWAALTTLHIPLSTQSKQQVLMRQIYFPTCTTAAPQTSLQQLELRFEKSQS
jgi:hypothetical protein